MKNKFKQKIKLIFLISIMLCLGFMAYAEKGKDIQIPALVSTEWLMDNASLENLVLLDIRENIQYAEGHIAGSINEPIIVPFSAWITMRDDLLLEVPDSEALFTTLGNLGITQESLVVVITSGTAIPPYPLANANRVADTLIYAGVENVSILDGGIDLWIAEGKPVTSEVPSVTPTVYQGCVDEGMFVSREYVKFRISRGKHRNFVLIDARDAEVYSGDVIEPFAPQAGHIPTAKSLPTVELWTADGKYKPLPELAALAESVVGARKSTEIVVYCGVGGYATAWWYTLTNLLGYRNVKIYDGSAEEWARYDTLVLD